jgi:hypothetical protein
VPVIADEDVDAVAVDGQGQPEPRQHLVKHGGVAMQILGRTEGEADDLARGVIDGAHQGELGAARFQPGEGTGVDLDQRSHGGLGDTTVTALTAAAPVLRRQAQRPTNPAHGGPADLQAAVIVGLPLFGEVAIVEPGIRRPQELPDPGRDLRRQASP